MLTPLEAKQFLAAALPERIGCGLNDDDDLPTGTHEWMFWWKNKDGSEDYIRETEWQQIALWCEEKIRLTNYWNPYMVRLWHLTCDKGKMQPYCDYGSPHCMWELITSSYITRATAIKEANIKQGEYPMTTRNEFDASKNKQNERKYMMDSTGSMRALPSEFFKDIPVAENPFTGRAMHQQGKPLRDAIQKACDAIEPDRSKQGPVFVQDEVVELKGRKFLITKIEQGHLRLKGLPADYMS